MEIYIEYVVFNNFLVDTMVLYWAGIAGGRKASFWRIAISATIGTLYAVFLPYISFKGDIAVKIALAVIMTLVAYRYNNIRAYALTLIYFFAFTFLLGGAIIALTYLGEYELYNSLTYPNSARTGLIAAGLIAVTFAVKIASRVMKEYIRKRRYIYNVSISHNKKSVTVRGFVDSGNRLYCGAYPVIIIDREVFEELFTKDEADACSKYIDVNTINATRKTKVFDVDGLSLEYNGEVKSVERVKAILSERKFKDYKILLHSDM